MKDIVHVLERMPQIGSTIKMYGKPVKVTGCLITTNAAYVSCECGNLVNIENLGRLENAKEY